MSKYVNRPEDIPKEEHYALITQTNVFIPGDERSRQAPGHGYPERTENYISYEAFTDKAELERRLRVIVFNRHTVREVPIVLHVKHVDVRVHLDLGGGHV